MHSAMQSHERPAELQQRFWVCVGLFALTLPGGPRPLFWHFSQDQSFVIGVFALGNLT
jgi:hypothetical protein